MSNIVIDKNDGVCYECGSTIKVIDCDDISLTVECSECYAEFTVEVDAFGDGGVTYWPLAMTMFHGEEW